MPWNKVEPMDEKIRFISDYLNRVFTFTELCDRYKISRKTGYKWVHRYEEAGASGLEDRARIPRRCPHKTPDAVEEAILEIRRKHPRWGAKKILAMLRRQRQPDPLPNKTTVANILKRHGCVQSPRKRIHRAHPGKPETEATSPNQLWSVDFKGQFKMGNGQYCYPLTIMDSASRFLLSILALDSTALKATQQEFRRLFRTYGLPNRIRSDNGTPFASIALGRLSTLSVWWIRLGIQPDLIEPGHPQQNGRHERMHRTLKAATTRPPEANLSAQQQRFDAFRQEYNDVRPHEALQQATPASVYTPSSKKLPKRIKSLDYPAHYEVRIVSKNSGIRWKSQWVSVTRLLAGLPIGLEEVDEGQWDVWFGPVWLGRLDERLWRIVDS
jgi:transposase InsO family protein